MLAQAEQGIIAKVPPALKEGFDKILHAGMTIMYSPKLAEQRNQRIAATTDPVKDAAEGSARMVSNLYQQSGKKLPAPLIVPAAMVFGFEWLDLLAKAGKANVTPDMIAQTTQAIADAVLPLMGITKDKLAALVAKAQQGNAGSAPPAAAPAGVPAPAAAPPAGIIGAAQGGA
jgi:hypothetical protein